MYRIAAVLIAALLVNLAVASTRETQIVRYIINLTSQMGFVHIQHHLCTQLSVEIDLEVRCYETLRSFNARLIAQEFDLYYDWYSYVRFDAFPLSAWESVEGVMNRAVIVDTTPEPTAVGIWIDERHEIIMIVDFVAD